MDVEVELAADRPVHLAARTFLARADRRTSAPPARSYVNLVLQGVEEHGLPAVAREAVARASGLGLQASGKAVGRSF